MPIESLLDRLFRKYGGQGNNLAAKAMLQREVRDYAAELAGPNPTPIEIVLARTAAINWAALRCDEATYAEQSANGEWPISRSESHERRIDRAHRRYMITLKTLAVVRRHAVPAAQINVARRQVNHVNTAVSMDPNRYEVSEPELLRGLRLFGRGRFLRDHP